MQIENKKSLNKRIPIIAMIIAIMTLLLPLFSSTTEVSAERIDQKVKIEYEFVEKGELSKAELVHLKAGIPNIKATKDAKYLVVYSAKGVSSGTAGINNASTPKTGDSSMILRSSLAAVLASTLAFAIYCIRKKKNAAKAGIALMIASGLVLTVPMADETLAYQNNTLKKYNQTQYLSVGEPLFQNLNVVQGRTILGVIDVADLNGNNPSQNPNNPQNPDHLLFFSHIHTNIARAISSESSFINSILPSRLSSRILLVGSEMLTAATACPFCIIGTPTQNSPTSRSSLSNE